MTAQEIADSTGRSKGWVRDRLAAAVRAGEMTVAWRRSARIDGTACQVPVYQMAKPRKKGR